jgi:transcriptional regulator with XRE-family HTH domain
MTQTFAECEILSQGRFRKEGLKSSFALCKNRGMIGPASNLHLQLRAWRKFRGLTLEQVQNRIGSKVSTISGWETGGRTVDLDDLKKLAEVYQVHPAALLFAPPGDRHFKDMRDASLLLTSMTEKQAAAWLAMGAELAAKQAEAQGAHPVEVDPGAPLPRQGK